MEVLHASISRNFRGYRSLEIINFYTFIKERHNKVSAMWRSLLVRFITWQSTPR